MPRAAQLSNQVQSVLLRHAEVADQYVGMRSGKGVDCRAGAISSGDDGTNSFKHQRQDATGVGLVVYNQHLHAIETDGRAGCSALGIRGFIRCTVACNPYVLNFLSSSQADSSMRRQSAGLGLGLSIVKYIVEAHGGNVDATRTRDRCSSFCFLSPLSPDVVKDGNLLSGQNPASTAPLVDAVLAELV